MNNTARWRMLRPIMLIVWGMFALVLTTQTDQMPLVKLVGSTIGSTEFGATLGHIGLFGVLTAVGYLALNHLLTRRQALSLTMLSALPIATTTELFQNVVSGRSSSLSDLLANWLGILLVGFVIAYSAMPLSRENVAQS